MVNRKRSQLNKDQTEACCVLDNIGDGNVINPKNEKLNKQIKTKTQRKYNHQ